MNRVQCSISKRETRWLRRRLGLGLTELIVAMILLGVFVTSIVPLVMKVQSLELQQAKKSEALLIASNIVELLRSEPVERWSELAGNPQGWQSMLPDSDFTWNVVVADSETDTRVQANVEVTFPVQGGERSVQLSTWGRKSASSEEETP